MLIPLVKQSRIENKCTGMWPDSFYWLYKDLVPHLKWYRPSYSAPRESKSYWKIIIDILSKTGLYKSLSLQEHSPTYCIAENFDGRKFWRFWRFPARPSKYNLSNCLKTVQHLQVYGERQWPPVKIFSVKYLKI